MEKNTVVKNIVEETKDSITYIGKWLTSKEGVTQMRNGCAMGVAGYVVGSAVRKILYAKSSIRNGWYSRYINSPFAQKGIKADDKGCMIYAITAMALDVVLTLDGAGVIKLPSFFGEDNIEEETEPESETDMLRKALDALNSEEFLTAMESTVVDEETNNG